MLIIVNGPAGSGKSKIAKYIAEKYNFEWVNVDSLKKSFRKSEAGFNRKLHLPLIFREVKQIILNYNIQNKSVVIDEAFGDGVLEFIDFANENSIKWVEIFLECPLSTCIERCQKRGSSEREFSSQKVTNTWDLLQDYNQSVNHEIIRIDAGKDFDEVCKDINNLSFD
jgi:thymidylate kinase